MRITCVHGYFKFEEQKAGQIAHLAELFGFSFSFVSDYFTFEFLADAKNYSILGNEYLGVPATKTFEGKPEDVMRENGLVYDFDKGFVRPITSIVQPIRLVSNSRYFLSTGLILPGSVREDGSRVTDYSAWFSFDTVKFKYSEIDSE